MKLRKLIKKYKMYLVIGGLIILIIIIPIIMNFSIFKYPTERTNGTREDWMGFFSNYSGGIIGGVVAYIIAKFQIQNNNSGKTIDDKRNEKLALQKVQYEILKIEREFSILKEVKEMEYRLSKNIPYTNFDIHRLNPRNWTDIGLIENHNL